ncbi:MAG: Fe-S-containing hydro-lyase [Lachnospiraceae bacterium]|nr:Fe-S-containing hydro-lyase [Lachnospiraceae bacterium]MBQ9234690.1 Fe-S-containing hydro-lyase [Lachnospiraceae bacterium]
MTDNNIAENISEKKIINVPFSKEEVIKLKAGEYIYLTGTIYSARDAAHKRMYDSINDAAWKNPAAAEYDGKKLYKEGILPFDITDNVIYYLGPTPAKPGQVIGSAGPTTSTRMDKYTPLLLSKGLSGMIGKGKRGEAVINAIVENKAVYMAAVGGAGALLSKCIKESEVIAYDDLGTEAIRRMRVEELPVIVVIDSEGNNLYETAVEEYKASR